MAEHYISEYNKEFDAILEDGVEYDTTGDGNIVKMKENLYTELED